MNTVEKIFILLLLIIALFLRVWKLNSVPIAVFGDEIDVGIQANSILTTGQDYMGTRWPVMFHSFAEYRLPMQLYTDVPFIRLFGLNAVGVRMAAVVFGIFALISFYFLVRYWFGNRIALISAVFMAISPWHFMFSRQANDAGFLLPFVLSGILFFLKGVDNFRYLVLSATMFALSIYAYAIASLFTPLLVFALIFIYRSKVLKLGYRKLVIVCFVGLVVLAPYLKVTLSGTAEKRFSDISVINKKDIAAQVEGKRYLVDKQLTRLYYNKVTTPMIKVFDNYTQSFSPYFLFSQGDPNLRQSVVDFGEFYHYDILLVGLGIFISIATYLKSKERDRKVYLLILIWLLLAPLPSALTKGGGMHASRLILMLPPLVILSAIGFNRLMMNRKGFLKKVTLSALVLFMFFDISFFFYNYFEMWPKESWRYWQYGFKDVIRYVKSVDSSYQKVFLTNVYEPMLPRFLFWYDYDMKLFHKQFTDDKHIANIYPGFNGFKLGDKFYFGEMVKPIEPLAQKGNLVVASAEKDATDETIFATNPDLDLLFFNESPTRTPLFYVFTKYQKPSASY